MPDSESVLDSREAGGRYIRGSGFRAMAFVAAIAVNIGATTLVTRHLHRASYGRLIAVTSLLVIVASITEGGLGNLGLREYSNAGEKERREFMSNLIGLRIGLSTLGGIGAVCFAIVAGYTRAEVEGTVIASVGLVASNLQVTLAIPLVAGLRLGWMAVIDFVGPFLNALLFVIFVALDAPLLPFYAAGTVCVTFTLGLTSVLVRREVHVLPSFDLSRWRFLLGQTVVVAAATTLTTVYFQVVVVATSLLSNAGQLGSFSLAFRVLTVVVGIPGLLVTSALPIFIRAARDDRERLRFALQRLIEGALLIGGWFSLLVVTGAGFAVHILGGPGYPGSAGALEILGWGLIATFLQLVFQLTLFSLQRYRTLIVMNAAMLLASVALCVALIPRYGAHGAAIVTLSVEVALAVASGAALFISNRSLLPRDSRPARAVVAVVIAFGVALVVPVSSVVAALIGSATLAAAATLLRAAPAGLFAALRPDR